MTNRRKGKEEEECKEKQSGGDDSYFGATNWKKCACDFSSLAIYVVCFEIERLARTFVHRVLPPSLSFFLFRLFVVIVIFIILFIIFLVFSLSATPVVCWFARTFFYRLASLIHSSLSSTPGTLCATRVFSSNSVVRHLRLVKLIFCIFCPSFEF